MVASASQARIIILGRTPFICSCYLDLHCLLNGRVQGLRWLRFIYVYPYLVSARLINIVSSSDRICSYIDMPLQHASAFV